MIKNNSQPLARSLATIPVLLRPISVGVGVVKMSIHLNHMKEVVCKTFPVLRDELVSSLAGQESEYRTLDIRETTIYYDDQSSQVVRKVFIEASDSSSLTSVGWVINDNITFCLVCKSVFKLLTRRHHCRACGLLVCGMCCRPAVLRDFPELGNQRICNKCNPNVSCGGVLSIFLFIAAIRYSHFYCHSLG